MGFFQMVVVLMARMFTRVCFWFSHLCKQFPIVYRFWKILFLCNRYKFDDERVTKEDTKKAFEDQYGGEEEVCSISHRY